MSTAPPRPGTAGGTSRSVSINPPTSTTSLLQDLLKAVSRSFYLTLRVLPRPVRPQIGLAYLLARASDTVADTDLVPVTERIECLRSIQARLAGKSLVSLPLLGSSQANASERELLERSEELYALLETFHPDDQEKIRRVLEVIISGQILDLQRFGQASAASVAALADASELDDYIFRVAGCVGEFWTEMCRTHLLSRARLDHTEHLRKGIRFGKGLQLVNILRDVAGDLRQGRCYFPATELNAAGLTPQQLLDPAHFGTFRPIYLAWLKIAGGHLAAGWEYTNALPWRCVRLRLACSWPILIGMATLRALEARNVLDPAQRVKIGRADVKRIILQTLLRYPFPRAWRRLAVVA